MKNYELTYLISADLLEEEVKSLGEKIVSQIQEIGGILNETVSLPIKKSLAFPIKKEGSAHLATLSFQLYPEKLPDLEKGLKTESNILRYLILGKKIPKEVITIPAKKPRKIVKPKAELKEIEKKLEEILKES